MYGGLNGGAAGLKTPCSGLRTNQGAMAEVRACGAIARGDFDLASAPWQSPRDDKINLFFL